MFDPSSPSTSRAFCTDPAHQDALPVSALGILCSQSSNVRCLTRLPIVRPSIQSARPGLDARQNATISLDADSVPSHTLPCRHIASSHSPTWAIPSIFPQPSLIDTAAFFANVPNLPPGPFSRAIHSTYQVLRVSRKSSTLSPGSSTPLRGAFSSLPEIGSPPQAITPCAPAISFRSQSG